MTGHGYGRVESKKTRRLWRGGGVRTVDRDTMSGRRDLETHPQGVLYRRLTLNVTRLGTVFTPATRSYLGPQVVELRSGQAYSTADKTGVGSGWTGARDNKTLG